LVVYTEVYRLGDDESTTKYYMKNVTCVESSKWLLQLCSPILLQYSKPILDAKLLTSELKIAKLMAKQLKTQLVS
jgi:hypothetical protein